MHVLCDTCSVIMLLRIAPEMFRDSRYECVTLNAVFGELRRKNKFKTKYPWLDTYLPKVRGLPQTTVETAEYKRTLAVVRASSDSARSANDNHRFGLSYVDIEIAATVVTHHYPICTAERDLEEFLNQEFDIENEAPLKIVNNWIEKGCSSGQRRNSAFWRIGLLRTNGANHYLRFSGSRNSRSASIRARDAPQLRTILQLLS